jgi:metal-responsive CopG/Arc/MetJ family transcriptional regulator
MAHDRARYDTLLQVCAPKCLIAAVDQTAERQLTSRSNYVRTAVLAQLRSDGIEVDRLAGAALP